MALHAQVKRNSHRSGVVRYRITFLVFVCKLYVESSAKETAARIPKAPSELTADPV